MADDESRLTSIPLGKWRRAVAKVMNGSAAVPQFNIDRDVDLSPLLALKSQLPKSLSVIDLIHAAVARQLVEHPRLNSSWRETEIIEFGDVNLGVAIGLPDGLVAPAMMSAETLTLVELAESRRRLQESALAGTLSAAELTSATFTVSNLGPLDRKSVV